MHITACAFRRHVFFAVNYGLVFCLGQDLLLNLDRLLVVANIVNGWVLLGFAPHILQVDGPFLQPPNDRLYVRDLLLLVVWPRRYTAPALVEDFVDLAYRLDGILLGVFVVGGIRAAIGNCQEVSGTT